MTESSIDETGVNLRPDPALMYSGIQAVRIAGSPIEIRGIGIRSDGPARLYGRTRNMFLDDSSDLETAVRNLARLTGRDLSGLYMTINHLDPIVLNYGLNRWAQSVKATADENVVRLCHLFVDLDPVRPSLTNATEVEHAAAMARLDDVRAYMTGNGWPAPVLAGSSGSGAMALYRIDLPPSEAGIVESTLQALAAEFNDDLVTIDTGVFNPARIIRIPGTINAKSPTPQPDRPWTMATAKAVTHVE